jgi:hypothetical protein
MADADPALPPALHTAMRAWRDAHPQATLAEIEAAVEQQLNQLRAALVAAAAPPAAATVATRPTCPTCATPLWARGERERRLTVAGGQQVCLRRPYYWCPTCAVGLFPPG